MIDFGTIGTSWITHDWIAHSQSTSQWRLRAVYSRSEETARTFASRYAGQGSIAIHTSLDALAADETISTVYVASPNLLHHAQARQMLSAGKNVVLEKPATCTGAELDELFAVARERRVFLIEAYRHIHERNFAALERALPRLGRIHGASVTFMQYSSRYEAVLRGELPNIFNLDMGGGALPDLGVYTACFALRLFGAPRSSSYRPVLLSTGADGAGTLVLEYPDFSVTCNSSKMHASTLPTEIWGEHGTLVVPTVTDIESVVFVDPRKKGPEGRQELGGDKEELNLRPEAAEFARIMQEGDWEGMGKLERLSRDIVKVVEAARRENGLLFPAERSGQ